MTGSPGDMSKGRTEMAVTIQKQRIKERKQSRNEARERLASEYGNLPNPARRADGSGVLSRLWRRLRGR